MTPFQTLEELKAEMAAIMERITPELAQALKAAPRSQTVEPWRGAWYACERLIPPPGSAEGMGWRFRVSLDVLIAPVEFHYREVG